MTGLLIANLVFFIIPVSGASTSAFLVHKFLRPRPATNSGLPARRHEDTRCPLPDQTI
jgi:hypothetical protein